MKEILEKYKNLIFYQNFRKQLLLYKLEPFVKKICLSNERNLKNMLNIY